MRSSRSPLSKRATVRQLITGIALSAPMYQLLRRAGVAIALLLLGGSVALACTGPPVPNVQDAFNSADVIVVAQLVSLEKTPMEGDTSGQVVIENAVFKVIEAFKGSLVKGDVLHVRSQIGLGSCGRSAKNDPPWMEAFDPQTGKPTVPKLSGKWLIYGSGQEPYGLNKLTRTQPMEYGGDDDLADLRKLKRALAH